MDNSFEKSNLLVERCLGFSDDAIKKMDEGHDADEPLTRLRELAGNIPSDASHAHVQLLESFSQGSFAATGIASEPQLALNPVHKVEGHWDSGHDVRALCKGMVHGGILSLDGPKGTERFLLAGGCIHINNGHYEKKRKAKYFHRFSGIGLTVRKLDNSTDTIPLVTTHFGKPNLDNFAFDDKGWAYFENMINVSNKDNFCGRLSSRKNNFYLMHLLRTSEINRCYSAINGSSNSFNSPFFSEKATQKIFVRNSDHHPRIGDANQKRNRFSNRFSNLTSDPFSPWFSPSFENGEVLHHTPYLRVISPAPTERPALITYIVGYRYILHKSRESYGNRWKDWLDKKTWSTRMALIG